jgi:Protein of unknown function (DUF2778)
LVHVDVRSISAGIAALSLGFAVGLLATYDVRPANAGLGVVLARISDFGMIHPNSDELRPADGPQGRALVRVASLGPELFSESMMEEPDPPVVTRSHFSFNERFFASLERPFSVVALARGGAAETTEADERAYDAPPPSPDAGERATASPAAGRSAPKLASVNSSSPLAGAAKKRLRTADASNPASGADSRTAIYDISAHTVYLPNGRRLEAHSGLGGQMDDPRYITAKGRGPTPPNVYDLTLREEMFHGVRAIRLNPVDDGKMFGRAGMLAHTYMLGPNGQSNGCVSFSDYPAFLNAFLRGEVDRLVVVDHLGNAPSQEASGWLPEAILNLFRRS